MIPQGHSLHSEHGFSLLLKTGGFIGILVAGIFFWFLSEPIPQAVIYHDFADQRSLFNIPHGMDVLSNVAFCMAGVWGCTSIAKRTSKLSDLDVIYLMFFIGVFFTGLGSAYYHWSPDNAALVWDRLPMTVAFMAFTSLVLYERYSEAFGYKFFPWLLTIGVVSVLYWSWMDDLRPYLIVQFGPILILPLLIWRSRGPGTCWLWFSIMFYLVAKLLELSDYQVFDITEGRVSGHTLKHITAAGAALMIVTKSIMPTAKPYLSTPEKQKKHGDGLDV